MAQVGARATMEGFVLQMFGEENWNRYPAGHRERILANAERFFTIGMPASLEQVLDGKVLATSGVPVVPMIGEGNREQFWGAIGQWIARQTGNDVVVIPGLHAGDVTNPLEFVEILRPILRKLS